MKKLILSLFVLLFGLISFGYCDTVGTLINSNNIPTTNIDTHTRKNLIDLGYEGEYTVCFRLYGHTNSTVYIGISQYYQQIPDAYVRYYRGWAGQYYCIFKSINDGYLVARSMDSTDTIYGDYFILNDLLDTTIPELTQGECQVKYNLIPIEHVDQHYCETNDLCPEQNECTGTGGISELFINNISHIGAPLINITIPEEFNWDYTGNEEEFNLSVEGYNVDTEYIDGIIRTQNYKPTSEDFTQLVGMLAPYSKYLLFLLFIFIIWAWIKKPFKSKKL